MKALAYFSRFKVHCSSILSMRFNQLSSGVFSLRGVHELSNEAFSTAASIAPLSLSNT